MTTANLATEQFGDISKASVDAALKFAKVSIESAERVFALNVEATKVTLDQGAKNGKAIAGVKDVQDLDKLRSTIAETGLEFATAYSRNVYELTTAAQAQFTALVEDRVNAFQKSVAEGLDKAAKSAPAGSDVAIAALKSALAASTAAADTLTKAAKQASSYADASFKAAASNVKAATAPAKGKK